MFSLIRFAPPRHAIGAPKRNVRRTSSVHALGAVPSESAPVDDPPAPRAPAPLASVPLAAASSANAALASPPAASAQPPAPRPRRAVQPTASVNPMLGLVRLNAPRHAIQRAKQSLLRRSATKVVVAAPIVSATVVVADGGGLVPQAHVAAGDGVNGYRPHSPLAPSTTAPTTVPATSVAPAATRPLVPPTPSRPASPAPPAAPPPPSPVVVAARVPHTAKTVPLGVYPSSGDPAGVAAFAAATGTHPQLLSEYLDGSSGWGGMIGSAGTWRSSVYRLVLGVPIIPDGTGGSLAAGAWGAYNSYFGALAQNLVNAGEANAILRLGWEFNGTWYNWSVANSADAANFAAFFRNIVDAMRSVPGQAFQFVWNPNGDGPTNYTPDQAYPGSGYVDFIGTDVYDNCWCSPATPQGAWADQLSHPWGLNWLASFAAEQGRPIAFPEWGLSRRSDGHGMGDDPYFIDSFAAWVTQSDVAWTSYFNADPSGQADAITDGSFPQALAAFQRDFG